MTRLAALLLALLLALPLAGSALAQDDGGYPAPDPYPEPTPYPSYPDPTPEPQPQGTGYGTITFTVQAAYDVDFYIDGAYACRGPANSYCTAQTAVGHHNITARTIQTVPQESSGSAEVGDGVDTSLTFTGTGPADNGPQPTPDPVTQSGGGNGYATITFYNTGSNDLDFYVDGAYACRATGGSYCSSQVGAGTHSFTARSPTGLFADITESATIESGATPSWSVNSGSPAPVNGGGGGGPAADAAITFYNTGSNNIDFYIDGVYACRAAAGGYCSATIAPGAHTFTARVPGAPWPDITESATIAAGTAPSWSVNSGPALDTNAPQPAPAQGGTGAPQPAPAEQSGGGPGQGVILFDNQSRYTIDFSIDGQAACRAPGPGSCSAYATPGPHTIYGRTDSVPAYEITDTVTVAEGATATYAVGNAAETTPPPATSGTPEAPPETRPVPPPVTPNVPEMPAPPGGNAAPPAAPGTGNVTFQNLMGTSVEFYLDGAFLCSAPAGQSCTGAVPPGGGASVTVRPGR